MKFVLVNGRMPHTQSACGLCRGLVRSGYLREIGTGLFYCSHDCYAKHCTSAAQALANLARASFVVFTSSRTKAEAECWPLGPSRKEFNRWPERYQRRVSTGPTCVKELPMTTLAEIPTMIRSSETARGSQERTL